MNKIELTDESFWYLVSLQRFMQMERVRNNESYKGIPTFDEVIEQLQINVKYVNDENAKLIQQLLLNEIKPYYMEQKHFDETKSLRDEIRKKQLEEK